MDGWTNETGYRMKRVMRGSDVMKPLLHAHQARHEVNRKESLYATSVVPSLQNDRAVA
jgi:hypothetical protein